jgi:hypothetical protein
MKHLIEFLICGTIGTLPSYTPSDRVTATLSIA